MRIVGAGAIWRTATVVVVTHLAAWSVSLAGPGERPQTAPPMQICQAPVTPFDPQGSRPGQPPVGGNLGGIRPGPGSGGGLGPPSLPVNVLPGGAGPDVPGVVFDPRTLPGAPLADPADGVTTVRPAAASPGAAPGQRSFWVGPILRMKDLIVDEPVLGATYEK